MEERTYSVYKHTSPSGKVYIGITKIKPKYRWGNGNRYKQSPHFYSAIQKYGWENIKHEILFEHLSKGEACQKEKELIQSYNATDGRFGYNEKTGGQTGVVFNKGVREKISKKLSAYYKDHPEEKERLSKERKGWAISESARSKMSRAKIGTHHETTEEWRNNISRSLKKRFELDADLREETAKKCRERGNAASKPVVQMDINGNDIRAYKSAREAERETGTRGGNISKCCHGLAKTANGFKWRFATEL